jgi:hypothetical protein
MTPIITTTKVMRPREDNDHYPTPYELARAALDQLPYMNYPQSVLDAGCGSGVWGQAARDKWGYSFLLDGVDIRDVGVPAGYGEVYQLDYTTERLDGKYDVVIGNPPYSHAEAFVRKALTNTFNGGYVLFLLRLAMLEGQARMTGLWREYPPMRVAVLGARPSFTGNGKTDATAYAVYLWRKGYDGETTLSWLDWKGVR